MSESLIPVPAEWKARAFMNKAQYEAAYDAALKNPDAFWGKEAERLTWIKPFTKVGNWSFDVADLQARDAQHDRGLEHHAAGGLELGERPFGELHRNGSVAAVHRGARCRTDREDTLT